jgi:hypothetical protein
MTNEILEKAKRLKANYLCGKKEVKNNIFGDPHLINDFVDFAPTVYDAYIAQSEEVEKLIAKAKHCEGWMNEWEKRCDKGNIEYEKLERQFNEQSELVKELVEAFNEAKKYLGNWMTEQLFYEAFGELEKRFEALKKAGAL